MPVAARDEEKQSTTQESMFNFIRLSDGGIVRLNNVRSEVDIISEVAEAVIDSDILDFKPFKDHQNIRKAIMAGKGTDELREIALDNGMLTLRMDGLKKVERAATTLEEVIKETSAGD